jgi:hypothetical protein
MDFMRAVWFLPDSGFRLRKLLQGALAGFIATAPMSLCMVMGWRLLPRREKYPLPPWLITEEIAERVGIEDDMSEPGLVGLTLLSHFGYGAMFGAVYALFQHQISLHSSLKGILTGLAVWAGSYLGWLPAMGILRPATRHPWRRNLLMIVAHVVWGVSLGEGLQKLERDQQT